MAADPPDFFPLIVRGGRGLAVTHDGSTLTVQFRKSSVAAGGPTSYGHLPSGSGAWVDRPVNDAEPNIIRQQITRDNAAECVAVLQNEVGFWNFLCRNTNSGYFEVHRSQRVFMEQKFD